MWKIINDKDFDVLKKTQENLETVQNNNMMISEILSNIAKYNNKSETKIKTDEEKKLAAYALNLCTVSVSQIIDYNDIFFLEREYDAILNNLNLEQMPKDEPLLKILKHLLDVITFFRIQEGDKKMLEAEYNQRVKDAIWSAIPNPSIIVASGNPISIAVSLASQVGIGYMNYKKQMSNISLDQKSKEWQMQRSAIEQFNGLRRELFDTAWRLADEYNFPDEYRITERQISQYNNILLDNDSLRRYERLEYISDKFKAYPPFLYYLGNAANEVYQDDLYSLEIRHKYKQIAISHFNTYLNATKNNLLREDQLVASCALEMIDLLSEDKTEEKELLLKRAINTSGNSIDVLQLAAISYLKIGNISESIKLLKMLINESHNTSLNTQLLSRLYVSQIINGDNNANIEYQLLDSRTHNKSNLFPLPKTFRHVGDVAETLSHEFLLSQKQYLKIKTSETMFSYISLLEHKYNLLCKQDGNITASMAEYIDKFSNDISIFLDTSNYKIIKKVKKSINSTKTNYYGFMKMLENSDERKKGRYQIPFESIFKESFIYLTEVINYKINSCSNMNDISIYESLLNKFIIDNDIRIDTNNNTYIQPNNEFSLIELVFGDNYSNRYQEDIDVTNFISNLKDQNINENTILNSKDKIEFLTRGDIQFSSYIQRNKKIISNNMKKTIVAILNDKSSTDTDLIFTTDKIYLIGSYLSFNKHIKACESYKNILPNKAGDSILIGKYSFENKKVNISELFKIIKLFAILSNDSNNNIYSLANEIKNIIAD